MCEPIIQVYIEFERDFGADGIPTDAQKTYGPKEFYNDFAKAVEQIKTDIGCHHNYYVSYAPGNPALIGGIMVELLIPEHHDGLAYKALEKARAELYRKGPEYWVSIDIRQRGESCPQVISNQKE